MENIFKNAYFGKAYKTRDGRKAILVSLSDFAELTMELDNPPYITSINITCGLDGKIINKYLSSNQDIVSEWHEEINEEELGKLADEYAENRWNSYAMIERQAFKADKLS